MYRAWRMVYTVRRLLPCTASSSGAACHMARVMGPGMVCMSMIFLPICLPAPLISCYVRGVSRRMRAMYGDAIHTLVPGPAGPGPPPPICRCTYIHSGTGFPIQDVCRYKLPGERRGGGSGKTERNKMEMALRVPPRAHAQARTCLLVYRLSSFQPMRGEETRDRKVHGASSSLSL